MRLDIAAQTDVGRRKKKNEDSHGICREGTPGLRLFQEGVLVCVADGLGGHQGGEIASKLAVSFVKDIIKEEPPPMPHEMDDVDVCDGGPLPIMREAILKANAGIYQDNLNNGLLKTKRPMGTTLLVGLVEPKRVHIGNVGDSRCYHFRDGDIIDHTEDHSWVDEQVKLGLMSKAEASTDRRKNIVTRCVGTHAETVVDTYRWHIVPGDSLLFCTDGLVNMVPDQEIITIFRQYGTAADIAQRLVNMANENGGKDNTTVIVVHVSPHVLYQVYLRFRSLIRQRGFRSVFMFGAYGLACAAVGYFLGMAVAPDVFVERLVGWVNSFFQ